MRSQGALRVDVVCEAVEELWVSFWPLPRFVLSLQVLDFGAANLWVQSQGASDRGRVLFRKQRMRLANRPDAIVEAFERTGTIAARLEDSSAESVRAATQELDEIWRELCIEVITSG
jgi:hypothetical protein